MRIEKKDLNSNAITSLIQALDLDITDANSLKNAIDAFITEIGAGKNLSGESYIKVKNKLSSYNSILEKRISTAKALKEVIGSAVNQMKSYVGDEEVIDEAKLPELEAQRSQAQNTVYSISEQINEETSEEVKQELKEQLYAPFELIKEIDKLKEKIEGLATADSSAYSIIESAKSNISGYDLAVSSLKESQITTL